MRGFSWTGVVIAVTAAGALSGAVLASQEQRPPQFRGGVTLVPVEIRAIDKDGRPVTDLTAADFVIRDAGQREEVAQFRAVSAESGSDESGRTFFVVLDRGRLNQPTKALQALIDFVRTNLLARDRVGVFAYLRIIDPTTDHEGVARFLERFRDRHERIEGLLRADTRRYLLPLLPVLGQDTRAAIEELFQPGAMSRDLPGATGDALGHFNSYNFLRKSLEYLRQIDGEKHAIMVSESPIGMGLVHDDPIKNFWFRWATDARTSLSFIHAGGETGSGLSQGRIMSRGYNGIDGGRIKDHALLTAQTGGLSAFYQLTKQPLASLDRATRFHYVLGYYPTRPASADQYRRYEVEVTRPGVRLLYRHGYVAKPPAERPAEYRQAVTESRLDDAAFRILEPLQVSFITPERWQMRLNSPAWAGSTAGGEVRVGISFDARRASTIRDGDTYLTDIDLLLMADDASRKVIAERRLKINIRLSAAEFARTRREWLRYQTTIEAKARPAFLRAVLYDFENDRSAATEVRLNPQPLPGSGR